MLPQLNFFYDIYIFHKNYAGDDDEDEDEEMADPDEDEDEEELDEYVVWISFPVSDLMDSYYRYSDDEDTSYKIRRSATKLLSAVIGTRPDRLTRTYKDISSVLISRFGDREETVRLEIWATYVVLLNQTTLYGGLPDTKDDASPRGKRKRDTEETMDVEETPYTLLKAQVPVLSKALLNQLKSPKTSPTVLQAGFGLLHALLTVLPGSFSTQAPLIISTSKSVLSQAPSTSTSTLHLTCLSFLTLFFATHSPLSFSSNLPALTPVLLKSLGERHPRIASETFRVFSALLNALKPLKADDWTVALYDQALNRLRSHDTDADVRGYAEDCMADIWICATEVALSKDRKEWEYICRTTAKSESGVKVITKVAKEVQVGDDWVNMCVSWLMGLLTKSARMGKVEVFGALDVLLNRYFFASFSYRKRLLTSHSYISGIPPALPPSLIPQIKAYISTSDISLLSQALSTLALLLELSPSVTFPQVESGLLNDIYNIAHSPLVAGVALDSLFRFFSALVLADNQISTHVVPNLVISSEKAAKAENSPSNVAKCIGHIVGSQLSIAAGTIAEYAKHLKVLYSFFLSGVVC